MVGAEFLPTHRLQREGSGRTGNISSSALVQDWDQSGGKHNSCHKNHHLSMVRGKLGRGERRLGWQVGQMRERMSCGDLLSEM